jgi:hypothetical protein
MSTVRPWHERPIEEAALFNPAFLATVLHHIAKNFEEERGEGFPFALAFVSAPLVMVSMIRDALPGRKDTSLAAWLQGHPQIRLNFAVLAGAMVPVVREGILYGLSKEALQLDGAAIKAKALGKRASAVLGEGTKEMLEILHKARFVGRWYANAGTAETIMVLWGVRP